MPVVAIIMAHGGRSPLGKVEMEGGGEEGA